MRQLLFASLVLVAFVGVAAGSGCGGKVDYEGDDDTSTGTDTSTSTSTGTSTGVSTGGSTGTFTGTATSTGTSTLTGTSTSTDTVVGCGDLIFADPTCEACVNAECCAEKATCSYGTDCDQVLQCIIFSCPSDDLQCIAVCKSMNASGAVAFDALFGCLEQACPFCLDDSQPG